MNIAICSNMDEPRDYETKWNKLGRERQISYEITYMWNLKKMIEMNLFTTQKQIKNIENKLLPKKRVEEKDKLKICA